MRYKIHKNEWIFILAKVLSILNRIYETGRKVAKGFKESMTIIFDEFLGQWNYVTVPEN